MDARRRISLSDPVLRGSLRNHSRSSEYVRRPTAQTNRRSLISDVRDAGPSQQSPDVSFVPLNPQSSGDDSSTQSRVQSLYQKEVKPEKARAKSLSDFISRQIKQNKLRTSLTALAAVIFICGLAISINSWQTLQTAQVQAAKLTQEANNKADSNSNPAPSTTKPSANDIADYVVGPTMPRYLKIPKLGVYARIKPLGVTNSDELEAPTNVYDTGWYNGSSLPGQPGAMLIDGHISSWTAHGVFYGLKKLVAGDTMQVVRGDGTVFNYKVVKTIVYKANSVDMTTALTPVVPGKPGLNLMSCDGQVISGTSLFNERIVVFTVQE